MSLLTDSLQTADKFPVVASLPLKNSLDLRTQVAKSFPWRKTFHDLALKIKEVTHKTSRKIVRGGYVYKSK